MRVDSASGNINLVCRDCGIRHYIGEMSMAVGDTDRWHESS